MEIDAVTEATHSHCPLETTAPAPDVPLDELRRALGGHRVHYAPGYGSAGAGSNAALLREVATKLARSADVSIVFVGLEEQENPKDSKDSTVAILTYPPTT